MLCFLFLNMSHFERVLNVSASSSTRESPSILMAARMEGMLMSMFFSRAVVTAMSALTIPAKSLIIGIMVSMAGTSEVRRSSMKRFTFIPSPNWRESAWVAEYRPLREIDPMSVEADRSRRLRAPS